MPLTNRNIQESISQLLRPYHATLHVLGINFRDSHIYCLNISLAFLETCTDIFNTMQILVSIHVPRTCRTNMQEEGHDDWRGTNGCPKSCSSLRKYAATY
ncbi:hypothetical protein e1004f01.tmp0151 [Eimeria tenella]|uniref:Uncharacterized protein n=1 Tax=Eimeria tenella TaxID=5802 RepID=C8TE29_EIMTE|nr:hypothetical protein e1004f01.tmp0151 [Eimeria tenella]